jgi:pimeloyl-ACP methyl ester carboxylesterase
LLDGLGLQQVVLGGHSFGGALALYVAAHHPGRVSKLVLIDAAAWVPPNQREMKSKGKSTCPHLCPGAPKSASTGTSTAINMMLDKPTVVHGPSSI